MALGGVCAGGGDFQPARADRGVFAGDVPGVGGGGLPSEDVVAAVGVDVGVGGGVAVVFRFGAESAEEFAPGGGRGGTVSGGVGVQRYLAGSYGGSGAAFSELAAAGGVDAGAYCAWDCFRIALWGFWEI